MKTKRTLSLFLVLVMMLGMLPIAAITAAADGDSGATEVKMYILRINGKNVTSATKDDVLGDGGSVKFDPDTYTLTLDDPAGLVSINHDYNIQKLKPGLTEVRDAILTIKGRWTTAENAGSQPIDWDVCEGSGEPSRRNPLAAIDIQGNCELILDGDFTFPENSGYAYDILASKQATVRSGSLSLYANSFSFQLSKLYIDGRVTSVYLKSRSGAALDIGGDLYLAPNLEITEPQEGHFDSDRRSIVDGSGNRANEVRIERNDSVRGVWIDGTRLTDDLVGNYPAEWGNTTFDPQTNTLTLDFTDKFKPNPYDLFIDPAVFTNIDGLKVKGKLNAQYHDYGISSSGTLTVCGDLTVISHHYAITAGALTYENGAELVHPTDAVFADGVILQPKVAGSSGSGIPLPVKFRIHEDYDLWLGDKQVTSRNCDAIYGDRFTTFDPETGVLDAQSLPISGTHENALIYSGLPSLTIKTSWAMVMRTDADYGIKATGDVSFANKLLFIAKTCAVSAGGFGCWQGMKTPAGGSFYDGAVHDANGDVAFAAGSIEYEAYDLWVGKTRVDSVNCGNIVGDGKIVFDPLTSTLTLNKDSVIEGTKEDSVIYSALPSLTLKGFSSVVGDASYGVRTTGDLTIDGYLSITGAVSAVLFGGDLSFGENVTLKFPAQGVISNGTICSAGGVTAKTVKTDLPMEFDLWLGSRRVTNANCADVFGDGKASFDPFTRALTLDDPTIPGAYNDGNGHTVTIYCEKMDIRIAGRYHDTAYDTMYGIVVKRGSLEMSGDFLLSSTDCGIIVGDDVFAPEALSPGYHYNAEFDGDISVYGDHGIVVNGYMTVNGDMEISAPTYGIRALDGVYIECRNFTITGKNGIYCSNLVTGSALVTVSGLSDRILLDCSSVALYADDFVIENNDKTHLTIIEPQTWHFSKEYKSLLNRNNKSSVSAGRVEFGQKYDLIVGGVTVNSANEADIFGDGKASFDPKTCTLTLNDPTINGIFENIDGSKLKIYSDKIDLTVTGSYTMSTEDVDYGIYAADGSLTLDGDFGFSGTTAAICSQGDLTLSGNITGSGGNIGIASMGSIGITEGDVSASGSRTGMGAYGDVAIGDGVSSVTLDGGIVALEAQTGLEYNAELIFIEEPTDGYYHNKTIVDPNEHADPSEGPLVGMQSGTTWFAARHVVFRQSADYDVWIGGTRVTSINYRDVLGDGTVAFDIENNVLTVNGDVTLDDSYEDSLIYTDGIDLTVRGSGSVTGDAANGIYVHSYYEQPGGALTLDGEVTFTADEAAIRAKSVTLTEHLEFSAPAGGYFGAGAVCPAGSETPATTVSTQRITRYNVWLGETQVTNLNCADVFGDGRASYDVSTGVLTLNAPTIPGASPLTTLGNTAKIKAVGVDLTVRGTYAMASADNCAAGIEVHGGTLSLEGFFTFRGTNTGVWCDRHITAKGDLKAYGESYAGIDFHGSEEGEGLELIPCAYYDTTLEMQGWYYAFYNNGLTLLPTEGLDVVEPSGGRISYPTRRIVESDGTTQAMYAILKVDHYAAGDGTEADPYIVSTAAEWNELAAEIERGLDTTGLYFNQVGQVTVSTALGTAYNPFCGTFDGTYSNGLPLHLVLGEAGTYAAPFRYVSGATIKNVTVDGSVIGYSTSGLVGAIVGGSNTIENCVVDASISTHNPIAGGFVGNGGSYQTAITNCVFTGAVLPAVLPGQLIAGENASTFWGTSASGATVTLTNCLDLSGSSAPIGHGDGTFTLTNVYTSNDTTWQGSKRGYSIIGAGLTLNVTSACGVEYDGIIYAAEGETLTFTTSLGETQLLASAGTLTQDSANFTLTVPAENVSVCRKTSVTYAVNCNEHPGGGLLYASRMSTYEGNIVMVWGQADGGYIFDTVTVTDSQGSDVPVYLDAAGEHYFIMPADDVTIDGTFTLKYSFDETTGELVLLRGEWGTNAYDRFASGFPANLVTSVTAEPGVRFTGSCSELFLGFSSCTTFDLRNVDTSMMTGAKNMFAGCSSMTSVRFTGCDISRITNYQSMFEGCSALTSVSLDITNGAAVTDTRDMFKNCSSLESVDISTLNVTSETNTAGMFGGASALNTLAVPGGMAVDAGMLLNNGGYGWVKDGTATVLCYGDEYGVFTAPAGAAATYRHATDVFGQRYSFDDATGTLTLNWGVFNAADGFGSNFDRDDVLAVTANSGVYFTGDCTGLFDGFTNCASFDLSKVNTTGMTNMNSMFYDCESVASLNLSGWDVSAAEDMNAAFGYCSSLTCLDTFGWGTSAVTDMSNMFVGCESLVSIDLSGWDTGAVTDMYNMFEDCTSLVSVDMGGLDVSNVGSFYGTFSGCTGLTSVDMTGWDTSSVTELDEMFKDCTSLVSLDLSHFDTSDVKTMSGMFENCSNLVSLDLSSFDTSKVTDMSELFAGCAALTSLDISGFTLNPYYDDWSDEYCDPYTDGMFYGCTALEKLVLHANFAVNEDMCLANSNWTVGGDDTRAVVSGDGEYARISAFTDVTVLIPVAKLTDLDSDCTVSMGAAADSAKTRADLYFTIPDGDDPSDYTVTINGVEKPLGSLLPDANGYKFSLTVPAKNMGDEIEYSLNYNGTAVKSGEVSVADYADHLAALYPQYADFVDAMLAYGAAAQTYFNYDADNLVSDADLTALAPVSADRFDAAAIQSAMIADDEIPVHYSAMNVTFLADTTLSLAFRIKDGFTDNEALEWVNANVTLGGAAVEGTVSTSGDYRFVVISKQNIAITDIDVPMDLVVNGAGTYSVSVFNYFAAVEAAGGDNLKLLTRALYAYSQAAKAIAG